MAVFMKAQMDDTGRKIRAAVVGASGYTGVELLRLLINHPVVEITALTSESYADSPIEEVFPSLFGTLKLTCTKFDAREVAKRADVIFLAVPHKTAMTAAVELLPCLEYCVWFSCEHCAAKSLQSCLTLCDRMDCSLPGFFV